MPEKKNGLKQRDTNFRTLHSSFLALVKVIEFHCTYAYSNSRLRIEKYKTSKLLRFENENALLRMKPKSLMD
jgi:hypothetical protein